MADGNPSTQNTVASWWGNLSRKTRYYTKGIAALTATCGLVIAVGPAWTTLGLPIPATQAHVAKEIQRVEKKVDDSRQATLPRLIANQIETLEGRREAVDKEIFELDRLLRVQLPNDVRPTLELRKRSREDDRRNIDFRLGRLLQEQAAP